MQRTVVMSFKTLPQAEVILFAANVILKMDGVAAYLVHKKDVDALIPIAQAFSNAFNDALNNDAVLNMVKDRKHVVLLKQLEVVAIDVDDVAVGNKEYIIGAGFAVRKDVQALSSLAVPPNFKAFNHERNGSVTLDWGKVIGMSSYVVQMRIVGEALWQTVSTQTAIGFTVNNLVRGSHVEFRVCASGTRGIVSDWTRVIDVFVD